jgi:hypothetical protein
MKAIPKVASRVIPREQLDGSIVDLLDSTMNFRAPGFLGVTVDIVVQTFQ